MKQGILQSCGDWDLHLKVSTWTNIKRGELLHVNAMKLHFNLGIVMNWFTYSLAESLPLPRAFLFLLVFFFLSVINSTFIQTVLQHLTREHNKLFTRHLSLVVSFFPACTSRLDITSFSFSTQSKKHKKWSTVRATTNLRKGWGSKSFLIYTMTRSKMWCLSFWQVAQVLNTNKS